MQTGKRAILIGMAFWASFVPVCWGEGDDAVLSGRHLLQAVRDSSPTRGERLPTAMELLEKYAETQDKLGQSFRIATETTGRGATNHPVTPPRFKGKTRYTVTHSELCCEGSRMSVRLHRWLNLVRLPDKPLGRKHNSYNYMRQLWDGKLAWGYGSGPGGHMGRISVNAGIDAEEELTIARSYESVMMGYFSGDSERVDGILGRCHGVSVRSQTETVGKWECHVIDADTKHGKYTLWIDPSHGHNIARADIQKRQGDVAYGKRMEAGMSASSFYRVLQFEQVGGIWLPMEGELEGQLKWGGGYFSGGKSHIKRTSVILDPNHNTLGSFVLDEVPNGAKVLIVGLPTEIAYTWREGEVVDANGLKVDLEKLEVERKRAERRRKRK